MARCPLCTERPAKRFCPAKDTLICSTCCGTRREVDIDCPFSCSYLRVGRAYENKHREPDAELMTRVQDFDKDLVRSFALAIDRLTLAVAEERAHSPWLIDTDAIEVFKALYATIKTLSSGIYYETLPEGGVRLSLFRRLRIELDELMNPPPGDDHPAMRVTDVLKLLDFMTVVSTVSSNVRPRSREYLDTVSSVAGSYDASGETSRLILP